MNDGAVPPILSALGASQATLRAAILGAATGKPVDPPGTRLTPLAKWLACNWCPARRSAGPARH
jgi:hypothetical protein